MSKNSYLKILMAALIAALIMLSLSACSSDKDEPKENDGLVLGTLLELNDGLFLSEQDITDFEKGERDSIEFEGDWV
jgi:hypothetical protein